MKKLSIVIALLILSALPVHAETVRTCSSIYGGGDVCGETTVVEHKVIETGVAEEQMIKILATCAGSALIATILYRLTYRSYILG